MKASERARARLSSADRIALGESASTYGGGGDGASVLDSGFGESASVLAGGAAAGGEGEESPLDTNTQLQLIFSYYCKFGRTGGAGDEQDTLDNANFSKFARECPDLMDRVLNATEVDLIFVKCKAKGARRLSYGQFLDALSALATVKYHYVEDPVTAFSLLLSHHVFRCPASIGIAAAVRSGMLQVAPTGAGGRKGPGAGDESVVAGGADGESFSESGGSGTGGGGDSRVFGNVGAGVSSAAAPGSPAGAPPSSAGGGPRSASSKGGPASPSAAAAPAGASGGVGAGAGAGAGPMALVPVMALLPSPGAPGNAAAGIPPGFMPVQVLMPAPAGTIFPGGASASGGGAAAGSFAGMGTMPFAMGGMGMGIGMGMGASGAGAMPASPAYGGSTGGAGGGDSASTMGGGDAGLPGLLAAAAVGRGRQIAANSVSRRRAGSQSSASIGPSASVLAGAMAGSTLGGMGGMGSSGSVYGGGGGGGGAGSVISYAGPGGAGGSVLSGAARARSARLSASRSPSRGSLLGTPSYKPTMAGEANKPGGVYDRLASPDTFTGVYRRAWLTDGRINHFTETGLSRIPSKFEGHTNTGSNETIHSLSHMLRPNLSQGKGFKP